MALILGSPLATQAPLVIAQDQEDDKKPSLLELEEVVVTGTAGGTVTKLESSIAITSMDNDDISRLQPMSAADLLETVPGFFTEDSAGESNANFSARGTWGDSNRMIGMHNDGVLTAYSDVFTGSLIKSDLMTARVDVVRGGTSGIISPRGPTAMVNFITRKGTQDPEGMIRQSITDYGSYRTEGYYSGPLNDEWVFAVGGFYRTGDGVRDRGFKADVGGQLRFNMTRELEDGELTFSLQHVDDKNAFYLPTPMTDKSDPDSIPGGVDALDGTLASVDAKNLNALSPEGVIGFDLQDGFHTNSTVVGMDFEKGFTDSNWSVKNQFRYMNYKGDGSAIYPNGDGEIQLASDRLYGDDGIADGVGGLEQTVLDYFSGAGATSAQFAYASSGELISPNDMDSLNGNGLTNTLTFRNFGYHLKQTVNNLNVTHETDNNTFTLGSVLIDSTYSKLYRNQHRYLADLTDGARKLDVVALNDAGETVGHLTSNGYTQFFTEDTDATVDLRSVSLYFLNDIQVTDDLRIDFGARWERLKVDTVGRTTSPGLAVAESLNNPDVIADDTVGAYRDGGSFVASPRSETDVGWSIGANYVINDSLAVYSHFTDTFLFRSDLLGEAINASRSNDVTQGQKDSKTELQFFELGVRYSGDTLGASVTLYNTQFTPQAINVTITDANGNDILQSVEFDTEAWGIEYEMSWAPSDWFTLDVGGVIQEAEYTGASGLLNGIQVSGNQINRVANEQIRINPTFHVGGMDIFFTYHYLGDRFGNPSNSSELPAYGTLEAGFDYQITDDLSFMLKGNNLTDQVGLSEGNPRDAALQLGSAQVADNFYARSIFGRTITASVSLAF